MFAVYCCFALLSFGVQIRNVHSQGSPMTATVYWYQGSDAAWYNAIGLCQVTVATQIGLTCRLAEILTPGQWNQLLAVAATFPPNFGRWWVGAFNAWPNQIYNCTGSPDAAQWQWYFTGAPMKVGYWPPGNPEFQTGQACVGIQNDNNFITYTVAPCGNVWGILCTCY